MALPARHHGGRSSTHQPRVDQKQNGLEGGWGGAAELSLACFVDQQHADSAADDFSTACSKQCRVIKLFNDWSVAQLYLKMYYNYVWIAKKNIHNSVVSNRCHQERGHLAGCSVLRHVSTWLVVRVCPCVCARARCVVYVCSV